eukprot:15733273-Heterocapsa_arctica.AAC.1
MFFASMWTARPRQRATHSFGFIADRRREEAQLIIQVACWRLHQIGYSPVSIFYDIANAFPSMTRSELDRVVVSVARSDD